MLLVAKVLGPSLLLGWRSSQNHVVPKGPNSHGRGRHQGVPSEFRRSYWRLGKEESFLENSPNLSMLLGARTLLGWSNKNNLEAIAIRLEN